MGENIPNSNGETRRKVLQATGCTLSGSLIASHVSASKEGASYRENYMKLIKKRQKENLHVREWRRLLVDEGFELYFDDIGRIVEFNDEKREIVLYPTIVPIDSGRAFVDLGWEQWHRTPDGVQDFQIFDLPEGSRKLDSYRDRRVSAGERRSGTTVHQQDLRTVRKDFSEQSTSVDPFVGHLIQSDSLPDFQPTFGFMRTGKVENLPVERDGLPARGYTDENLDFSSIHSKSLSEFPRTGSSVTPNEAHSVFMYFLSADGYSPPDMVHTQLKSLRNHLYNRTNGAVDLVVYDQRQIGAGTFWKSESEFVEDSLREYAEKDYLVEGSHFLVAHSAGRFGYGGGKFSGTINGKQAWGEAVCTEDIIPDWEQRHFVWHESLHMLGGHEGDHYRGCYDIDYGGGHTWAEEITPLAFGYVYDKDGSNSISYPTDASNFDNDHFICGEDSEVSRPNPNSYLDHNSGEGTNSWTYSITDEIKNKITLRQ